MKRNTETAAGTVRKPESVLQKERVGRNCGRMALWAVSGLIVAVLLILVVSYAFRESLPDAFDGISSWVDNLLNHLLYNEEERQILGF